MLDVIAPLAVGAAIAALGGIGAAVLAAIAVVWLARTLGAGGRPLCA